MSARYPRPVPAGFELPSFTPEPWTRDAACATTDPDMFFPHPSDVEGVRAAKRICAQCPVAADCLAFAARSPRQEHGIWGGKSFHKTRKGQP